MAEPFTEREYEQATRGINRRVAVAREDSAEFYSFVMKHETKRTPIVCAKHQRLAFAFMNFKKHRHCVIRMPPGFGKTYTTTSEILRELGQDNTRRIATISSTEDQAAKPITMVRDMIDARDDQFVELKLVYPSLKRSKRANDPWSATKITVQRPPGIRDASVHAYGVNTSSLPGARLWRIFVDDVLNKENTLTEDGRRKVLSWFDTEVQSRTDVFSGDENDSSGVVVTNTPWDKDDLTYQLERRNWPTLTMDCWGGILLSNTDWDCSAFRPNYRPYEIAREHGNDVESLRLTAHDSEVYVNHGSQLCVGEGRDTKPLEEGKVTPDQLVEASYVDFNNQVPLWPEVWDRVVIQAKRSKGSPIDFARNYEMRIVAREGSLIDPRWFDDCKHIGWTLGYTSMVPTYNGPNPTITGVDLGIGLKRSNDTTSIFTVELYPYMRRLPVPLKLSDGRVIDAVPAGAMRLLDVEIFKGRGKLIIQKLIQKRQAYNSSIRVENNAAQDLLVQWARESHVDLEVRGAPTGMNKHHVLHGVERVLGLAEERAWIIPATRNARGQFDVHPNIQQWIEGCVFYVRGNHTGDALMASWIAYCEARLHWDPEMKAPPQGPQRSLAAEIGRR